MTAIWIGVSAVGLFLVLLGYISLDIWRMTCRGIWFSLAAISWLAGLIIFILGVNQVT